MSFQFLKSKVPVSHEHQCIWYWLTVIVTNIREENQSKSINRNQKIISYLLYGYSHLQGSMYLHSHLWLIHEYMPNNSLEIFKTFLYKFTLIFSFEFSCVYNIQYQWTMWQCFLIIINCFTYHTHTVFLWAVSVKLYEILGCIMHYNFHHLWRNAWSTTLDLIIYPQQNTI